MQRIIGNQRGVTLVELIITLAVSAILMAGVATINFDTTDQQVNAAIADMSRIDVAVNLYLSSLKECPSNLQLLQDTNRIPFMYNLNRFSYTVSSDKKLYKIEYNTGSTIIKSPGSTL